MPEYVTVTEKIERRTHLKGHLTAKFTGALDESKSDLKIENFYDIEILEAQIIAERADFRTWQMGAYEDEDYPALENFIAALPDLIACAVRSEDGKIVNYQLHIFEPKIINHKIGNQVYEKERLFAVIEGEIFGYLRHYETQEKQIEVVRPAPKPLPPIVDTSLSERTSSDFSNAPAPPRPVSNNGCAPILGCSVAPGGCLSLLTVIFAAYFLIGIFAVILTALADFSAGVGVVFWAFLSSVAFPLLVVGTMLYFFVKVQPKVSWFWRFVFRAIIILLIFLFWFD